MKYKVGDKVRIKSLDWYNENKNKLGCVPLGQFSFNWCNTHLCGAILTIKKVLHDYYLVEENSAYWTDEMIEGLVEEENIHNKWNGLKVELELSKSIVGVSNIESLKGERFMSGFVKAIIPPDGYIFKDENDNEILTSKIILEKKKKEYPKTYEECCKIMQVARPTIWFDYDDVCSISEEGDEYECHIENTLCTFRKLLICRDAYWKIAGEEMGLRKPWEPDWLDDDIKKYVITSTKIFETFGGLGYINYILTFPTEEMRDAFYENFKKEIEQCKELL